MGHHTLLQAFQLHVSPPLAKSTYAYSTMTMATMPVKRHVVCDNGLVEDQYAWMENAIRTYAPTFVNGDDDDHDNAVSTSKLRFVRIPDILDMHALTAEEEGESEDTSSSITMMPTMDASAPAGMVGIATERAGGKASSSAPSYGSEGTTTMTTTHPRHGTYHRLRYDSSPYKNIMSYKRYCELEAMIAVIVKSYLDDVSGTQFCLLVHPSLQYDDSIASYWTMTEHAQTLRVTTDQQIGHSDLVIWTDQKKGRI